MSEETIVKGTAGTTSIRVLSASAQRAALTACAELFAADHAEGVRFAWATSGAVTARVESGEPFDIIAASHSALRALAQKSLVSSAVQTVGISRLALGMRKGGTPPDISTREKFCAALRAAKAISRGDPAGGGTAGIFLASMLDQIGLLDDIKDKSILRVGGYNVMKEVAEGRADFGLTQSTEIVAVEGVEISAWLPAELQMDTVYAVAASSDAIPAAARAFLDFVTGAKGRRIYSDAGFAPA